MSQPATAVPPERGPEKPLPLESQPEGTVPPGRLLLRIFWIAVQLIIAYWLGWQAQPFFYQRF
jgi:hypothetical protein